MFYIFLSEWKYSHTLVYELDDSQYTDVEISSNFIKNNMTLFCADISLITVINKSFYMSYWLEWNKILKIDLYI